MNILLIYLKCSLFKIYFCFLGSPKYHPGLQITLAPHKTATKPHHTLCIQFHKINWVTDFSILLQQAKNKIYSFWSRAGIRSIDFQANRSFFVKNERMSDSLQKISDSLIRSCLVNEMSDSLTSLISSEQPERIAHCRSFLVSQMSDSLTSLIWFERN